MLFDQPSTESQLTQDRVAALDGIDFPWATRRARNDRWDDMLDELAANKEQTGGFEIAGMRKELAKWVSNQRQQKKLLGQPGTESELTQDRIDALDGIDFTWAPQGRKPKVTKKRKR